MQDELKETVYHEYLKGLSEYEIADKLNLTQSKVHRILAKIKNAVEHRLSTVALYEFEQYFMEFQDAIKKDIQAISLELEQEKDPQRIERLREQRHNRRKDLWLLIGDGEMVLILRRLKKNGVIEVTA